jgi:hypothetical protein
MGHKQQFLQDIMYSFTITTKEFERMNNCLSLFLDIDCHNIEYKNTTFYTKSSGATKGTTGYKYTEQQRKNISDSLKGKSSSWLGKKHSEETKNKISEQKKGKKLSEETKQKMKLDGRQGRKHSEETKEKMKQLALIREESKRNLKNQTLGN